MRRTRALHRKARQRVPYPIVALVGYTNAGKSTLFNTLTGAAVLAEDTLFATLDPTFRGLRLPGGSKAVLSDTVGFISDLPTTLIAAFRATLEEVQEADLILHVRDIADATSASQRADVNAVLAELGIDADAEPDRLLEVWNKADLLDATARARIENEARRAAGGVVLVSAMTGDGPRCPADRDREAPQPAPRHHRDRGQARGGIALQLDLRELRGGAALRPRRGDDGLAHPHRTGEAPLAAAPSGTGTPQARGGIGRALAQPR